MSRIYLCLAHMSGHEMDFIKEAFDTNWVVPMGPNVTAFEHDLEKFVNSPDPDENSQLENNSKFKIQNSKLNKKVVCLSAGTAAVHLALIACDVKPGDEVLVQSFTFCASSHPITYLGAIPVFIDSEPHSWNMEPDLLEEAIKDRIAKTGKKPKAIIPVALYGMPYRIDRIMEIANRYEIPVIEDGAEGFGSYFNGQSLGTFGEYGVLSFNGNKMITTSGGGALICPDDEKAREILWYATQARESYPYYQHESIGYNYRMSNICAGIGRGQMTVVREHIAHHKHVQALYCDLLKDVPGIKMHQNPTLADYPDNSTTRQPDNSTTRQPDNSTTRQPDNSTTFDSNFWLCTATLDPDLRIKGQENAYGKIITGAVGGAAGVTHAASTAVTDCQPNDNVEALRMILDAADIEARPLWKPMHKQPVYRDAPAYINGVSESLFKVGICLPAGPWVTDDQVRYIVDTIKSAIQV